MILRLKLNTQIAPYWADVDITGTGNIGYRETRNPDLLQRANNDIRRAFSTIRFSSEYLFIATWDHVGYYSSRTDKVNICMISIPVSVKLYFQCMHI